MKIYTRTGDDGTTGLMGGVRVSKDDLRIAACGALDEFNAQLGVCRTLGLAAEVDAVVARVQHDLFALGAELASPEAAPRGSALVGDAEIGLVEQQIDRHERSLAPLADFILPGGSPAAAALHAARCVCRRAEREVVSLTHAAAVRPAALAYLNRVSDLLFVLARAANAEAGVPDVRWQKRSGA